MRAYAAKRHLVLASSVLEANGQRAVHEPSQRISLGAQALPALSFLFDAPLQAVILDFVRSASEGIVPRWDAPSYPFTVVLEVRDVGFG